MLLWPFNKYPGTDYETFNWEWILKTVKEYTEKVDDFIEDMTDAWNAFKNVINHKIDDFTEDITNTWNTFRNSINHEIAEMHRKFAIYVNVTEEALNTGAIADGAITEPKIESAFLKTIKNNYVTPEMYGAAGDGVTDDTAAVAAAIDSGLPVIGMGVYKVKHTTSGHLFVIDHETYIHGKFIDDTEYSSSFNLRQYGIFSIQADNVTLDIEIIGNNTLPVDSSNSENLSDVAGYAVDFSVTEKISNATINLKCEKINGVGHGGEVENAVINVNAKWSAYPYAINYANKCTVDITAKDIHRAFYGAIDNSIVTIKAQDYYSTGGSSHVLLTAMELTEYDNSIRHCNNSIFYVFDTGTTQTPDTCAYFDIYNQTSSDSVVNVEANIYGDVSTLTGAYAWLIHKKGTVNITGTITINNQMKQGVYDSNMYSAVGATIKVINNVICRTQINTDKKIKAYLRGQGLGSGSIVTVENVGNDSELEIENVQIVTFPNPLTMSAYNLIRLNNVPTITNPANANRYEVVNYKKYLDGVEQT